MANNKVVGILGVQHYEQESKKQLRTIKNKMGRNMMLLGDFLLAKMLVKTPIEFGPLRESGVVHRPIMKGLDQTMQITFGNEKVDYAVHVHERLDLKHAAPTQAKFMESVIQEEEANVIAILGAGVKL